MMTNRNIRHTCILELTNTFYEIFFFQYYTFCLLGVFSKSVKTMMKFESFEHVHFFTGLVWSSFYFSHVYVL